LADSNGDLVEAATEVAGIVEAEKIAFTTEDNIEVKATTTEIVEDTTQDPRDAEDTTEGSGVEVYEDEGELYEEEETEVVTLTTPSPTTSSLRAVRTRWFFIFP